MKQRKTYLRLHNINPDDSFTMIDRLIANELDFDPVQLREHFLIMQFGFIVMSVTLAGAILLLAMHPDVQEKLFDELNANLSGTFDEEDVEKCFKLRYLDMVFRESSRIFTAVPISAREATEDFEIEKGLIIPKGTSLMVNLNAIHRLKDIWGEDGDKFNPDNFLPENVATRHPLSFIAFLGSECIGYRLSMNLMKITIAKLIKSLRFSSQLRLKDIRTSQCITLKLLHEHSIEVERR